MCFALAGPMIIGGVYEAVLDNRVVEFVLEKRTNGNLTLDMRCRLLMMVLIGNLDLALGAEDNGAPARATSHSQRLSTANERADSSNGMVVLEGVPTDDGPKITRIPSTTGSEHTVGNILQRPVHATQQRNSSVSNATADGSHSQLVPGDRVLSRPHSAATHTDTELDDLTQARIPQRRSTRHLRPTPWRDMERLLYPIRLFDDDHPERGISPRQFSRRHRDLPCQDAAICMDESHLERLQPRPRTNMVKREIRKTKTRLRTMLNCQYSFGSMVGAPVVFFLGGFIFALVQSLQSFGNEDIALALAFGQWYMTIPHIAIISGLLLAGNNPNILEGVVATQRHEKEAEVKVLGLRFGLAYPSCYKVAWQWHRGHNKKLWIDKLLQTYSRGGVCPDGADRDEAGFVRDLEYLRNRTTLSPLDWFLVLFLVALLVGVPFFLAFITAFYTPQIGLSCESFTFLAYACSQFGQIILCVCFLFFGYLS